MDVDSLERRDSRAKARIVLDREKDRISARTARIKSGREEEEEEEVFNCRATGRRVKGRMTLDTSD